MLRLQLHAEFAIGLGHLVLSVVMLAILIVCAFEPLVLLDHVERYVHRLFHYTLRRMLPWSMGEVSEVFRNLVLVKETSATTKAGSSCKAHHVRLWILPPWSGTVKVCDGTFNFRKNFVCWIEIIIVSSIEQLHLTKNHNQSFQVSKSLRCMTYKFSKWRFSCSFEFFNYRGLPIYGYCWW